MSVPDCILCKERHIDRAHDTARCQLFTSCVQNSSIYVSLSSTERSFATFLLSTSDHQSMTLQRFRSDPTASFLHPFFNDPNARIDVRGSATDTIPLTLPHLYMYARLLSNNCFSSLTLQKHRIQLVVQLIRSLLAFFSFVFSSRYGLISSQNAMNNAVIKWFDEFLPRPIYFIAIPVYVCL